MRWKKDWLRPVAGVAVATVFVYLAFGRIGWGEIQPVLRSAAALPLLIALAALAGGLFVRIARWWWMLRVFEPALSLNACARTFLVSLALNNTVPLRAGDVYRVFGLRGALRSAPVQVAGTLVIERVLDLFVLLSLFFVGLLGVAAGSFPPAFIATGVTLGVLSVTGILFLVLMPHHLQRVLQAVLRRPAEKGRRWARRASSFVTQFFGGLSLLRSPARALQLLGLSLLAWMLEGFVFAAVAWSLHVGGSPAGPWFSLAAGTLATLIPSSPGHVGTFDYFAMLGLMSYGAAAAVAAAFALLVHLVLWLPVTLVGAMLLLAPSTRVRWTRTQSVTEPV